MLDRYEDKNDSYHICIYNFDAFCIGEVLGFYIFSTKKTPNATEKDIANNIHPIDVEEQKYSIIKRNPLPLMASVGAYVISSNILY